jgi:mRNA-degrading endonuclease RelE of RelBE toxin-antitoxin system
LTYKVLLHPKATKALQKLDDMNKNRIKKQLVELAGDPYKNGEPLVPADFWKIIMGDYLDWIMLIIMPSFSRI